MSNDRAAFDLPARGPRALAGRSAALTCALFAFPFLLGPTFTPAAMPGWLCCCWDCWVPGDMRWGMRPNAALRLLLGPAFSWVLIVLAVGMIAMSRGTGA